MTCFQIQVSLLLNLTVLRIIMIGWIDHTIWSRSMVTKYYRYDTSIFISIYRYLIHIDFLLTTHDMTSTLYLRTIYSGDLLLLFTISNGDLLLLFTVTCCCCLHVVVYSGGGHQSLPGFLLLLHRVASFLRCKWCYNVHLSETNVLAMF